MLMKPIDTFWFVNGSPILIRFVVHLSIFFYSFTVKPCNEFWLVNSSPSLIRFDVYLSIFLYNYMVSQRYGRSLIKPIDEFG